MKTRLAIGRFCFPLISLCIAAVTLGPGLLSFAANADFALLSLEELTAIRVTSVSKKSESLFGSPAAVNVITGDDILRAGAQTLPDALRLSPGTEVAQVDAHQWAVTVRGFNDTFAQKLLVLMDGRSIYSSIFSGVLWHGQDTMFEDLDRIEVIRGPGGTIWGANAVNGVINIVSKPVKDTQGWLVSGGGGSTHTAATGARYGGKIGENVFYRVYGKFDKWSDSDSVFGGAAQDSWWKQQGGFRLDWEATEQDLVTVQGDGMGLEAEQVVPVVTLPVNGVPPPPQGYVNPIPGDWKQTGGNVLGRWTRRFSEAADFSVQAYWDRIQMTLPVVKYTGDVYDLDLRQRFWWGSRQEIVWGGGYRAHVARTENSPGVIFRRNGTDQTFNAFLQDEITLVPEHLRWTLGSKVEHNDYTDFEYQPGTRLAWTPTDQQTIWASVARAVRVPSLAESESILTLGAFPANPPTQPFPTVVRVTGNPQMKSEDLIAYELGYRLKPHPQWALDLAVFLNDYQNLRSSFETIDPSTLPDYATLNSGINNDAQGQTYGGELAITWQTTDWWQMRGQLTCIDSDLETPPSNLTSMPSQIGISSPTWQASLRSDMDLSHGLELNVIVRYVGEIDSAGISGTGQMAQLSRVPDYLTFDVQIGWRPHADWEIAVLGQNLAGAHREFVPTYFSTQYTEISPSVMAKATWKF